MSPLVELNLSLILFLPWFAILAWLYWWFPRQPRTTARIGYDSAALGLAIAAFVVSIHWSHANADPLYGKLWQQILATALGYGVFLITLALAVGIRALWLRRS